MKYILSIIVLSFAFSAYSSSDSCECAEFSCNSCELQESLEFYTEKCEAGSKIKSCAKPICAPLDPLPQKCLAKAAKPVKRSVASVPLVEEFDAEDIKVEAGHVKKSVGAAWVVSALGKKQKIKRSMKIYNSDVVETGDSGKVEILFKDTNVLFISKNTKVKIKEYRTSLKKKDRKVLLNLLKGKLRSSVKKKYENSQSSFYRVTTKSAVAGVRGTDFIVELKSGAKLETKVTTLSGEVELGSIKQNTQRVKIPADYTASFVAKGQLVDKATPNGYLTPVYRVSKADVEEIIAQTEWNYKIKKVHVGGATEDICSKPMADFNECMWKCENNPRGQKSCRTDLKEVQCLRKRCNANGEWVDVFRLPASVGQQCPPSGFKVKSCDY